MDILPNEIVIEIILYLDDIDLFPTFFHVKNEWNLRIFNDQVFWRLYIQKNKKLDVEFKDGLMDWKEYFITKVFERMYFLYEKNQFLRGCFTATTTHILCSITNSGEVEYKKSSDTGCHFDHVDIPSDHNNFTLMLSSEQFRRVKQIIKYSKIKKIELSERVKKILHDRRDSAQRDIYSYNATNTCNWKIIRIRNRYYNQLPPVLFKYIREIKNMKKIKVVIFRLGYKLVRTKTAGKSQYTFLIDDTTHLIKKIEVFNKSGFFKRNRKTAKYFQKSVKAMKREFSVSGITSDDAIHLKVTIDFYNEGVNKRFCLKDFRINIRGKICEKYFLKFVFHK